MPYTKNYLRTLRKLDCIAIVVGARLSFCREGPALLGNYLKSDRHETVQCEGDKVVAAFKKMA